MIAWRSIEYRLTAWYSLLLFITLLTLGATFSFGLQENLRSAVDELLAERIDLLVQFAETIVDEDPSVGAEYEEDLGDLEEYLTSIAEGELSQIRSESGEVVIRPDAAAVIPWHETPNDDRNTYVTVETIRGPYRLLSRSVSLLGRPFRVQVASSLEPLEATQAYLIAWATWALPITLLLSFTGGYLISRRALRPVVRITSLAAATSVKNLSSRLPVPSTGDAIEHLVAAFNDMLDRLDGSLRRLKQFTSDASHELRTPLSVIRTTAELALRHGRSDEDFRRDMVEIHAEAQRLTELIDDLLLLARSDSGAHPFALTAVDLAAVVRSSCERFRSLLHEKSQSLDFHASECSSTIDGHESSLRRMMTALLENASEHTPRGGRITVGVERGDEGVRIRVADTGRGIPPEELDRIFDRFYRVDPSRARSSGGIGLGLSVVRWVAEYHGARIGVESELEKGSEFTIVFPQAHRPAEGPEKLPAAAS